MKINLDKRKICIIICIVAIALLVVAEIVGVGRLFGNALDEKAASWLGITTSRLLGSAVFLTILVYLEYKVMNPVRKPFFRSLLFCLPALCVVVNNMPIYPLATGSVEVTSPFWRIAILALQCFSVGLFEETCFRGVVFLGFLKRAKNGAVGRLLAILLSSAVFGLVHLVNIFLGESPTGVLMQIGYSFLIGAMCSVVLMKTANIWICVLLHAIFNFCGALVPDCGRGKLWEIWDPVTIVATVVVAVAVAAYMIFMFFRLKKEDIDRLYQ